MKSSVICAFCLVLLSMTLFAGRSGLTTTFQPLMHPSKQQIWIVPVTCHQWYWNSASSPVDLINAKNVPPSDKPNQAKYDLNLASICGIKFFINDRGATVDRKITRMTIDITKLNIPKDLASERTNIIKACIECLRRNLPPVDVPLTIKGGDKDKEWVAKIVEDFNSHDRSKPFYKSLADN